METSQPTRPRTAASMAWARRRAASRAPTPCSSTPARSLGRRSLARAARGDADGAVEDARRRTEIARQDAAAWRQYGLALLDRNREGDARDAVEALEVAVAGDPTDLGAAHSLARARGG